MKNTTDRTQDKLTREKTERHLRARINQFKQELFRLLADKGSPKDAIPITIALLEIAIEGHLVMTKDADETLDFVTKICRRVLEQIVRQAEARYPAYSGGSRPPIPE
jgi:hypothetical protein